MVIRCAVGRRGAGRWSSSAVNSGAQSTATHGRAGEEDHGQAQQPLRVRLAAVGVAGPGPHQQRHHDAGQHAAEQQLVDHARQGVGEVVVVADRDRADGGADRRGPDEAGDPADDAADRHDGAVPRDRPVAAAVGSASRRRRRGSGDRAGALGGRRRRALDGVAVGLRRRRARPARSLGSRRSGDRRLLGGDAGRVVLVPGYDRQSRSTVGYVGVVRLAAGRSRRDHGLVGVARPPLRPVAANLSCAETATTRRDPVAGGADRLADPMSATASRPRSTDRPAAPRSLELHAGLPGRRRARPTLRRGRPRAAPGRRLGARRAARPARRRSRLRHRRPARTRRSALVAGWAEAIWETGREFGTIGAAAATGSGWRSPRSGPRRTTGSAATRSSRTATACVDDLRPARLRDQRDGGQRARARVHRSVRRPGRPGGAGHPYAGHGRSESFGDDPLRMLRAARFAAQLRLRRRAGRGRAR